jgi:hypothetical protein
MRDNGPVKQQDEMIEGPEATAQFENTMQALFSQRKADVIPPKPKTHKLGRPKKQPEKQG